jgi:predicted nucleic acid-binding protein
MSKLKIYLDNCCYNRPYDDLTHPLVNDEATAKRFIQSLIKFGIIDLADSYMLYSEVMDNPYEYKKIQILEFIKAHAKEYIGDESREPLKPLTAEIMATGVKLQDAVHVACAIVAKCDYFLTTDKRLLKFKTDKLKICNPIEFVDIWRKAK